MKKFSDHEIVRTYNECGKSVRKTAVTLGVSRSTLRINMPKILARQHISSLEIPELPDGELSAKDLLSRRKEEFARKKEYEEARKLIPVKVNDDRPIGVLFFGDPHLDDAGCDIGAVEHDVELVKKTDGLYGVSIGDNQNNWIGRLSFLWGQQETTARQSWTLVEWFVNELGKAKKWLFMVNGNHDAWSGSGDPLKWMQRQQRILEGNDAVRIGLTFPNGKEFRIAARHNWPGNSIWNANHGQLRAGYMQVHDHLIVGGHKHSGGDQRFYVEASDMVVHAIQLGAYKIYDSFGKQMGFIRTQIAPSCLVIIDPASDHKAGFCHVYYDTALGARVLKAMRK